MIVSQILQFSPHTPGSRSWWRNIRMYSWSFTSVCLHDLYIFCNTDESLNLLLIQSEKSNFNIFIPWLVFFYIIFTFFYIAEIWFSSAIILRPWISLPRLPQQGSGFNVRPWASYVSRGYKLEIKRSVGLVPAWTAGKALFQASHLAFEYSIACGNISLLCICLP